MRLIVDIPNSLYANLAKIGNGSIAGKRIVECVKHGKPYKVDVLDKIRAEFINRYPKNYAGELAFDGNIRHFSLNDVMQIIDYVLRIDDNCRKGECK